MALYYLDTSALVKLYIREPGTDRMLRLAGRPAGNQLAVLALAQVEFRSALRRRERMGDIDRLAATDLIELFTRHLDTKFVRRSVNDVVLETASGLVDRYPLRAYDAVQLAGCLALKTTTGDAGPTFVCSDRQLLEAAESEGLPLLDPTDP